MGGAMSQQDFVLPSDSPETRRTDATFITDETVLVTGPMSSGTRLMCRIINAGGTHAVLDVWHGTVVSTAKMVVVMVRLPGATRRSRDAAFAEANRIPREASLAGCLTFYPDALWLSYEQLCAAPDQTIGILAEWLGKSPWAMPEEVVPHQIKEASWPSY